MKSYQKLYDFISTDFEECMKSKEDRLKYCPFKTIMELENDDCDIATVTFSSMPSIDKHGNYGCKTIYVNDETGEYKETYTLNGKEINYDGLTILRCAMVNKMIIDMLGFEERIKIGFIGNGRINYKTAEVLENIGTMVLRGSPRNPTKNFSKFSNIGYCKIDNRFEDLSECDVVIVCTNSYEKSNLISTDMLKCNTLIVLDCGYIIDESFRNEYDNFSDYPEQLESNYEHEFPFDKSNHKFKSIFDESFKSSRKKCIYVHGTAITDLSTAKWRESYAKT